MESPGFSDAGTETVGDAVVGALASPVVVEGGSAGQAGDSSRPASLVTLERGVWLGLLVVGGVPCTRVVCKALVSKTSDTLLTP